MKVLDIIKNLVRKDENRSHEDHLSELVPIDLVFRGYGFWGGRRRPYKAEVTSSSLVAPTPRKPSIYIGGFLF